VLGVSFLVAIALMATIPLYGIILGLALLGVYIVIITLVQIIEAIMFVTMSQEIFDARYNQLFVTTDQTVATSNASVFGINHEIARLDTLFTEGKITFEEYEERLKNKLTNS
jgi:hypothetical protein